MQIRITQAGARGEKYELLREDGTAQATRYSHRGYSACAVVVAVDAKRTYTSTTWHWTPELAHKEADRRTKGYKDTNAYYVRKGRELPYTSVTSYVVLANADRVAEVQALAKARAAAKRIPAEVIEGMRKACWAAVDGIRNGKLEEAKATLEDLRAKANGLRGPKQRDVAAYYAEIVRKDLDKALAHTAKA